ncbi:MAG: NPCBM/NEW2 domain-containing protein [Armatimonadota bacterium]
MRTQLMTMLFCSCIIGLVSGISADSMNAESKRPSVKLEIDDQFLVLKDTKNGKSLPVSLRSPGFTIDGKIISSSPPSGINGKIDSGKIVEVAYQPVSAGGSNLDIKLFLQRSPKESVIRKWASYRITGDTGPNLVSEIVLDRMDSSIKAKQVCRVPPQSYPILFDGFFGGIEFPVASTRIENGQAIIAHQPGIRLTPGKWYDTRKAVYGFASPGKERAAFEKYIASHYPQKKTLHLNYNSWWTTGIPYSEQEVLNIMKVFSDKLYKPYGVSFDTFCIDMGWSDKNTIWDINRKLFPDSFSKVQDGAAQMGASLGIWMSPASGYPEALDNNWAKEQGIKTFSTGAYPLICVTDQRYVDQIKEHMTGMAKDYGVSQYKFDNARLECPETSHGHEPGALSAEPLAESMISIFNAIREVQPNAFLESFAFGPYESPWWLFYVDALVSMYGADAPYGLVPCPVYRESYTTSRDYFNLIGDRMNVCPISDLDICGIVHQSPEPFMNDAVMSTMRGSVFLSFYVNHVYMNDSRWKMLADLMKWSRKNADIITKTQIILPKSTADGTASALPGEAPAPREPYGYAHWDGRKGLVIIRNPWIAPVSYKLELNDAIDTPDGLSDLSAVSIYPEVRLYSDNFKSGDTVTIPLAPYETLLLSINSSQPVQGIPNVSEQIGNRIKITGRQSNVEKVVFDGDQGHIGADWTNFTSGVKNVLHMKLSADVEVDAPNSELLILLEDKKVPVDPVCSVKINGEDVPVTLSGSDTGWAADASRADSHTEQWLFLRTPLSEGKNHVEIDLLNRSETPKVSAWVWATKEGKSARSKYPNALPEPEMIYLDAVNLLKPIDAADPLLPEVHMPALTEKIDGIYLDAMPADLLVLDQSLVKRNKSFTDKPIVICGRSYERGLGTVPTIKITVPVDGKYRRFQSWVGVDAGMELWDETMATFEVWVDGVKKWDSGIMERNVPAKFADVDITGAKSIELMIQNNATQKAFARALNNVDWAGARLLY